MNKSSCSKIVIAGANGFVGKNLRLFLNKNEINFVSISRKKYRPLKYETRRSTQYFLRKNNSRLFDCVTLVNLIGLGQEENDYSLNDVNVKLTKKMLALAKRSRIKKFIYISGLGTSKNALSDYFISKYNAEREIIKSGLDYTIFRASYIIGKNDLLTKKLRAQTKKGKITIPGSGKYHLQPISINDVCKTILFASESENLSKQILDLVGPDIVTFEKYVQLFSKKKRTKIEKIKLKEMFLDVSSGSNSKYTIDELNLLVGDYTGDHKKLKDLTGIKFQKIDEFLN